MRHTTDEKPLRLESVRVRNFKAITDTGHLRLGPLTVFVGHNGSGKSSLIEALETYQSIVVEGLDSAMQRWLGIEHVRHFAADQLLKDGCCCVLIIWDLRPAWPDMTDKPCRRAECDAVLARLSEAGVTDQDRVHLICIEQELESWLLANERAISAFLSTSAHPYQVSRIRDPDRERQPKAKMIEHFKKARGWRYNDSVHAIRVIQAYPLDFKRLRRSTSFARFERKLQGICSPG